LIVIRKCHRENEQLHTDQNGRTPPTSTPTCNHFSVKFLVDKDGGECIMIFDESVDMYELQKVVG